MKKWILGITGGIGSGKSTVAGLFISKGIEVIDADHVARLVVSKDTPALTEIHKHFGPQILRSDGNLNRPMLRQIIFNDPSQRQWLEKLLHPIIRKEICQLLNNTHSIYAILVSPLLIETKQTKLVNRLLVVDTPEEVQIGRSMQRDKTSEQQIKAIMQNQLSREKRLSYADDIIINNCSLDVLSKQVEHLHQHYLTLCQKECHEKKYPC